MQLRFVGSRLTPTPRLTFLSVCAIGAHERGALVRVAWRLSTSRHRDGLAVVLTRSIGERVCSVNICRCRYVHSYRARLSGYKIYCRVNILIIKYWHGSDAALLAPCYTCFQKSTKPTRAGKL